MPYILVYHPKVVSSDIPRLAKSAAALIQRAIEQRLIIDPVSYGLPLRAGLKGYRKMRVSDYRVVYSVVENQIRIIAIGHRKNIYEFAGSRL